jgi:hypothetical protein
MYGTVCASLLIKYPFLADYDGTGVSSNGFIDVHTFYIFFTWTFCSCKASAVHIIKYHLTLSISAAVIFVILAF